VAADHLKACTGIDSVVDTCDAQQAELAEKALSIDCGLLQERARSSVWSSWVLDSDWIPGKRMGSSNWFDYLELFFPGEYDWVNKTWH
jgi:hypothetical protein